MAKAHPFGGKFLDWLKLQSLGRSGAAKRPPKISQAELERCTTAATCSTGLLSGLLWETVARVYGAHSGAQTTAARTAIQEPWGKAAAVYHQCRFPGQHPLFDALMATALDQKACVHLVEASYSIAINKCNGLYTASLCCGRCLTAMFSTFQATSCS